jgi:hypothetical protein
MNNTRVEDIVFEATAGCAVGIVVGAFTALLYQLITVAVPLLESMAFPPVR